MDLGQQNNVIPRHLAPNTAKIGAGWKAVCLAAIMARPSHPYARIGIAEILRFVVYVLHYGYGTHNLAQK